MLPGLLPSPICKARQEATATLTKYEHMSMTATALRRDKKMLQTELAAHEDIMNTLQVRSSADIFMTSLPPTNELSQKLDIRF